MITRKRLIALGGSLLLGVASVTNADVVKGQEARIAALESQIAEFQSQQHQTWLTERRSEEVKSLVREVLADAETRASLLENGMNAGHQDGHFFLASDDGKFLAQISGIVQIRYNVTIRDRGTAAPAAGNDDG